MVYNLSDARRKYTAISYTWGAEASTKQIIINGVRRIVRWNCWYALRQMRCADTKVPYWIDSICIDQTSDSEKANQVRLMGFIYSQADSVAVSLGETGEDQDLFSASPTNAEYKWRYQNAMAELAERPYIDRLWVTQECMLAPKGRLTVFVGNDCVTWKTLRERIDLAGIAIVNGNQLLRVYNFVVDADTWNTQGYTPDFGHAISRYSERLCHDPRDKVFGLLGLVERTETEHIRVNYQVPLLDLLLDVASIQPNNDPARFAAVEPGDYARAGIDPVRWSLDHLPTTSLRDEFVPLCHEFRSDFALLFKYHCLGPSGTLNDRLRLQKTSWASGCKCKSLGELVDEWSSLLNAETRERSSPRAPCELVFLGQLPVFTRYRRRDFNEPMGSSRRNMFLLGDPHVRNLVLKFCATAHKRTHESYPYPLWTQKEVAEVLMS
ncbi:unnamed protein product [Zymoseptoria tritici ST99CH_3D1]|nr:unnamed protein product [Zymoseptoria tritici ST99CH_3D1]